MPTTEKVQTKIKTASTGQSTLNDDDTLIIIGIVGGVVAFIAILIIIICIIRLKMTSSQYRGGPITTGSIVSPGVIGSGSSCACSVKGAPQGSASVGPTLYAIPPSYAATLPHKMTPVHQDRSPITGN